jgi:hypothetical protein
MMLFFLSNAFIQIEDPTGTPGGIFDPNLVIYILMLADPQQADGNQLYGFGEANALAGIQFRKSVKCTMASTQE